MYLLILINMLMKNLFIDLVTTKSVFMNMYLSIASILNVLVFESFM